METGIPLLEIVSIDSVPDDADVVLLGLRFAGGETHGGIRFDLRTLEFGQIPHAGIAAMLRFNDRCSEVIASAVRKALAAYDSAETLTRLAVASSDADLMGAPADDDPEAQP